jgi:hypothetical protein
VELAAHCFVAFPLQNLTQGASVKGEMLFKVVQASFEIVSGGMVFGNVFSCFFQTGGVWGVVLGETVNFFVEMLLIFRP